MIETEIKFKIENVEEMRSKIKKIAEYTGTDFEENIVFDNKEDMLRKSDKLLRLRKVNDKSLITYKGPQISSDRHIKARSEIEAIVDSYENIKAIFEGLGFAPVRGYKKQREKYRIGKTELALDNNPYIGHYLEIEGSEKEIHKVIKELGLDIKNGTSKPYMALYEEYFKSKGIEPKRFMEFDKKSAKQIKEMK